MGHNGVNLNAGVQGFVQSMQDLKSEGVDNGVKLYAQPLKDENGNVQIDQETGNVKYNTYTSDNKKSWKWGATKNRKTKSDNAMKAFTSFINKVGVQHNLNKEVRISANALVASIFRDPDNAVSNMHKLANLLEDATGINPWRTEMRANQQANDMQVENHQLWQAMQNGDKGLLNPKSDFAKAIKKPVIPQTNKTQQNSNGLPKIFDINKDLGVEENKSNKTRPYQYNQRVYQYEPQSESNQIPPTFNNEEY